MKVSNCCKAEYFWESTSKSPIPIPICTKCGDECLIVDAEDQYESSLEEEQRLSEEYMANNNPEFYENF